MSHNGMASIKFIATLFGSCIIRILPTECAKI